MSDKWDLMKLKRFCKAKHIGNTIKLQPTDLEKFFTNPVSDRGLISKRYKELKKLGSSTQAQDHSALVMPAWCYLWTLVPSSTLCSPHVPVHQTWTVVSAGTRDKVASLTASKPLNTWWPDLSFDLCQLAAGLESWDIPTHECRWKQTACMGKRRSWAEGEGLIGCAFPSLSITCLRTPFTFALGMEEARQKFTGVEAQNNFIVPPGDVRLQEIPTGSFPLLGLDLSKKKLYHWGTLSGGQGLLGYPLCKCHL